MPFSIRLIIRLWPHLPGQPTQKTNQHRSINKYQGISYLRSGPPIVCVLCCVCCSTPHRICHQFAQSMPLPEDVSSAARTHARHPSVQLALLSEEFSINQLINHYPSPTHLPYRHCLIRRVNNLCVLSSILKRRIVSKHPSSIGLKKHKRNHRHLGSSDHNLG